MARTAIDDLVASALDTARQHLARGGMAMGLPPGPLNSAAPVQAPPASRFSIASPVAVLPGSMAHSLLHHALRQRPHFSTGGGAPLSIEHALRIAHEARKHQFAMRAGYDDGGDVGGDGDPGDGSDGYAGGSSIYGAYGGAHDSAAASSGGFGANSAADGFGGGIVGSGMAADSSTSVGRAMAQIGSLGGNLGSTSSYGGSYGAAPGGYTSGGSYDAGNIGPAGIASGSGMFGSNVASSQTAGFSNFGGADAGLSSSDSNGFGTGSPSIGFSAPAGTAMGIGNVGGFSPVGRGTDGTNYGSLGGFNANTASAPSDTTSAPAGFNGFSGYAGSGANAYSQGSMGGLATAAGFGSGMPGASGDAGETGLASSPAPVGVGALTGDPAAVAGTPALTVRGIPATTAFGASEGFGAFGSGEANNYAVSGYASPDDMGEVLNNPHGVSSPTQASFDNFNQGQALTAGLGYTPEGWSPQQEKMTMAESPGDYSDPGQYPALAGITGFNSFSPNFAKGLLGNMQAEAGPGLPTNAVNATGGDTGLAQWTGARRTGMLDSIGVDPSLRGDDLKAALSPDTFTGQLNYGLNEIATDPTYSKVLANAMNPDLSPQQQSYQVAMTYEAPPGITNDPTSVAARTELARRANYAANFGNDGATTGTSGYSIGSSPSTASPASYGFQGWSPGAASGTDTAPTSYAADVATALANRDPAMSATDGSSVPSERATGNYFSPGMASGLDSQFGVGPTSVGTTDQNFYGDSSAASDMAAARALDIASAIQAQPDYGSSSAVATSPVTGTPLTITPAAQTAPTATSTPSYFAGERGALKTAASVLGGVVGGPLGALGAGALAGWGLDHSTPGSVPAVGGQEGNSPGDPYRAATYAGYGGTGSTSAASSTSASAPTSTPSNANSIAAMAYANAVAHQVKGPSAKVANVVPLIAPNPTAPTAIYNPLSDPTVQAALRIAQQYRSA